MRARGRAQPRAAEPQEFDAAVTFEDGFVLVGAPPELVAPETGDPAVTVGEAAKREPLAADGPVGPASLDDLKKGVGLDGDSGASPLQLPTWLDMERCNRVKLFFAEHAASITFAWHAGLVIGFSIPDLLNPLVFTHQSSTPKKALLRYSNTWRHLAMWHTGNIWDPASKAHASVQAVRGMHRTVRDNMKAQTPPKAGTTWISMYDMGVVQSGFMGAAITVPTKFGLHASAKALEDYVYFWKCVGYLLGIDDKFNICSLGRPTAEQLVNEIESEVLLPDIQHPVPEYSPMAEAYISALNLLFLGLPVLSVKSTNALTFWALGRPRGPLSPADTCRYYLLRLICLLLGWLPVYRRSLNWALLRTLAAEDPVFPESAGRCPFSGRGAACATGPATAVCPGAAAACGGGGGEAPAEPRSAALLVAVLLPPVCILLAVGTALQAANVALVMLALRAWSCAWGLAPLVLAVLT